jgi:hypothetical protein
MKRLLAVLILGVVVVGCGPKATVYPPLAWERFQDPYFGISFSVPQGWVAQSEGGRFFFYSSQQAITRFYDLTTPGPDVARLTVSVQKKDSLSTLDQLVQTVQNDLSASGFTLNPAASGTLAGQPAITLEYHGAVDKETKLYAVQATAVADTSVYMVKFEGFDEAFAAYRAAFDSACASLALPAPKAVVDAADPSIPSTETKVFENDFLKITYPANFDASPAVPKAPAVFALDIIGYRQDSNVHIDVLPARGHPADSVIVQNAKFYKERSRGTAKVSGEQVTYLNYTPRGVQGVDSRVYFLVKNDRFYRIIFNYHAPMKDAFLPAFEQTVGSIQAKAPKQQ